jgi:hypothetical protein
MQSSILAGWWNSRPARHPKHVPPNREFDQPSRGVSLWQPRSFDEGDRRRDCGKLGPSNGRRRRWTKVRWQLCKGADSQKKRNEGRGRQNRQIHRADAEDRSAS